MQTKIRLASKKYCTGCMSCYDACKQDAIEIYNIVEIPYVRINAKKCIGCKQCEKACPIITPVKKNDIQDLQVFGGWAVDDKIRIEGASGGAFGAIAVNFFTLFEKVAIIGAMLENNQVYHTIITDKEDIYKLQNSKYIQSHTEGIYRKVKEYLNKGFYILFSGTPCQIAGLYGFLGKQKDDEKLYTIDLVCHGVASKEALDLHLNYYDSDRIYSFRDKKEGQYWNVSQSTTINVKGEILKIIRNQDIFYKIFASWLKDRRSCSNCKYSALPRIADITLADFWVKNSEYDEYDKGVSLIMVNNEHGELLIKRTVTLHYFEASLQSVLKSNPNIYNGYKYIQYHPIVIFPEFFKKHLSKSLYFSILTNKMPWKLFWAIYKILTILLNKYKYKKLEHYIHEKDRNYNNM